MCLAVPGKILSIVDHDGVMRTGRVSFGGMVKEVNLAYTPEAGVNDYVIVHVRRISMPHRVRRNRSVR